MAARFFMYASTLLLAAQALGPPEVGECAAQDGSCGTDPSDMMLLQMGVPSTSSTGSSTSSSTSSSSSTKCSSLPISTSLPSSDAPNLLYVRQVLSMTVPNITPFVTEPTSTKLESAMRDAQCNLLCTVTSCNEQVQASFTSGNPGSSLLAVEGRTTTSGNVTATVQIGPAPGGTGNALVDIQAEVGSLTATETTEAFVAAVQANPDIPADVRADITVASVAVNSQAVDSVEAVKKDRTFLLLGLLIPLMIFFVLLIVCLLV